MQAELVNAELKHICVTASISSIRKPIVLIFEFCDFEKAMHQWLPYKRNGYKTMKIIIQMAQSLI